MDPEILAEFREPDARTCPHAVACPGCPLLGLSYAEQRAHKAGLVRAAITPYPELAGLEVTPCVPGQPTYGYRTRAKWVAAGRALGLYARGTHQVVDLPGCLVVDSRIAHATQRLRALLPEQPLLDGADIARVGEQLLLTLIGAPDAQEEALQALARRLADALPELAGIAVTRRASAAVQLLAGGHQRVHGAAELRARATADRPYHYVAFGAFLQANEHIARSIRAELVRGCRVLQRERAARGEDEPLRVLELYAGSGALALELAAEGVRVTAVESYAPACERMQRAAREQGVALEVEQGDAEACVRAQLTQGTRFDVVLLNPPRRGLPPALRSAVAALRPARVGYVSCQPATLARDLAHFARLGLGAERIVPYDMMPHTEQVESLVWLEPGVASTAQILHREPALLALNKAPHERIDDGSPDTPALAQRLGPRPHADRAAYALSTDCSGVAVLVSAEAEEPALGRRAFVVLARGITHARGRAQGMRYQRERVVGGHSLLRMEAASEMKLRRALASLGHPVLGDRRADRDSAKYFWLRHGLDRAFVHLAEVELSASSGPLVRAALPPDLVAVLASLERERERENEDAR